MIELPANRLDIALVAGSYCAWEVRASTAVLMRQFDTLDELITHARHYAGMVWAHPQLQPQLRDAGLLLVREP